MMGASSETSGQCACRPLFPRFGSLSVQHPPREKRRYFRNFPENLRVFACLGLPNCTKPVCTGLTGKNGFSSGLTLSQSILTEAKNPWIILQLVKRGNAARAFAILPLSRDLLSSPRRSRHFGKSEVFPSEAWFSRKTLK